MQRNVFRKIYQTVLALTLKLFESVTQSKLNSDILKYRTAQLCRGWQESTDAFLLANKIIVNPLVYVGKYRVDLWRALINVMLSNNVF